MPDRLDADLVDRELTGIGAALYVWNGHGVSSVHGLVLLGSGARGSCRVVIHFRPQNTIPD
jgi:hypothetical protein